MKHTYMGSQKSFKKNLCFTCRTYSCKILQSHWFFYSDKGRCYQQCAGSGAPLWFISESANICIRYYHRLHRFFSQYSKIMKKPKCYLFLVKLFSIVINSIIKCFYSWVDRAWQIRCTCGLLICFKFRWAKTSSSFCKAF